MIDKGNKCMIVTTNNLKALEEVSLWTYAVLGTTYCIRIEKFPNMTLYRFIIQVNTDDVDAVVHSLAKYLSQIEIKLMN